MKTLLASSGHQQNVDPMRASFRSCILIITSLLAAVSARSGEAANQTLKRLHEEALERSPAYEQLRELTQKHPGRLAGSKALEGAVAWSEATLRRAGCETVRLQPVSVPVWRRGAPESFALLTQAPDGATREELAGLALGWSVSTPPGGLQAEVIEVKSLQELENMGRDAVAGKIVFFNRPMPASAVTPGAAYRAAIDQRSRGPALAARLGAVGALVRSLTLRHNNEPHTGHSSFPAEGPKIPAAALSVVAADRLSAALKTTPGVKVEMRVHGEWAGTAQSYNVIGEIRGSEFPDEIILVGAHLDSWDISEGAHDDGAGVVQSIEVMRLYHTLGLRPRHTLRCVLFTAEENSLAGGLEYARVAKEKAEKHVLAVETDGGGFAPRGFELGHTSQLPHERAARWKPLLEPFGLYLFEKGTGGADVGPLMMQGAVVADLLPVSQWYFDYHHARTDRIDAVHPRELKLGAAALASLIYLVDTQGL